MSHEHQQVSPVAVTLASITAIIGAPVMYDFTEPYVTPILIRGYGSEFVDLYRFVWGIATGALVYFPAYATYKMALTILATSLIYRLV